MPAVLPTGNFEHASEAVPRARGDRHTQDVLRSLSAGEQALIDSLSGRIISLPPNRDLISEGEVGAGLFRIERGWAYRYRRVGAGCRQILDFQLPGELVGMAAALLGVLDHSVRSLTPLRVTTFDPRLLADAFRREPGLALRLAQHLAAEASRGDALLSAIGCGAALERLAFLMVSLYRRQSHAASVDPADCPFPLRRQHIADALGLTGAHVNRTLNRMAAENIAVIDGPRLRIRDLPRLVALASGQACGSVAASAPEAIARGA